MADRSVTKALSDTHLLVSKLSVSKRKLINISIDKWGGVSIFVEPAEFVRLFSLMRVRQDKREIHAGTEGRVHARFFARNTTFSCMFQPDTPEMDALLGHVTQRRVAQESQPRIEHHQQRLLLTGPGEQ